MVQGYRERRVVVCMCRTMFGYSGVRGSNFPLCGFFSHCLSVVDFVMSIAAFWIAGLVGVRLTNLELNINRSAMVFLSGSDRNFEGRMWLSLSCGPGKNLNHLVEVKYYIDGSRWVYRATRRTIWSHLK